MFSYSDFKMALSLTILGDVVATTLKFINNARTSETEILSLNV